MEDHSRVIIHFDIDCFYAQVEMIKNPTLKNKPLGIQQKNIVVTSNYKAREYGIKKCMLITEAKKLCPNLVLVNGEDLYKYRQASYKVTSLLETFSEIVERLGLDENFIDVTNLVNEKLKGSNSTKPVGYMFGEPEVLCDCGCTERIIMGSHIAEEIRNQIYQTLHLTTCAGIAHNKLLAKIVGSKNKPNKQSLVFPNNATELIRSLELVRNIPWIGYVSAEQLSKANITTVEELQHSSIEQLKNIFGFEKAETMWKASYGIDNNPVKKTGKPQSIGIEDSCRPIITENEAKDKLKCLLKRLMILVKEDGRIPKTIKLTVRKFDSIRETKQCNISIPLDNEEKIMDVIMLLFGKAVDTKRKFHITLLGLSFTKFGEKTSIKNTLTSFLTQDKTIQSDVDYKNQQLSLPFVKESTSLNIENTKCEEISNYENFVTTNETLEYSNPSVKQNITTLMQKNSESVPEIKNKIINCPPHINEDIFRELPMDLQEELWNDYKRKREVDEIQQPQKKIKSNSILNYLVRH